MSRSPILLSLLLLFTAAAWPSPLEVRAGHASFICSAAYDARGDLLATADYGGVVKLWNGHSGRLLATLRDGGTDEVAVAVALSANGRTLLTCSQSTIRAWDVPRRRVRHKWSIRGDKADDPNLFGSVQMTLDGHYGLAADYFQQRPSWLFDLWTGRRLRAVPSKTLLTRDGHLLVPPGNYQRLDGSGHISVAVKPPWAVSPDGTRVAGMHLNEACIARIGGKTVTIHGQPREITWSPDSRRVAFRMEDRVLVVASNGRLLRTLPTDGAAAFVPGGRELINDGTLVNLQSGRNRVSVNENSSVGRWVISPAGDTFVGESSRLPRPGELPVGILPPMSLWSVGSGQAVARLGADIPWVEGIVETHGVLVLALNSARWDLERARSAFSGLALWNGRRFTWARRHGASLLTAGGDRLATVDDQGVSLCHIDGRVTQRIADHYTALISTDGKRMLLGDKWWPDGRAAPSSALGFAADGNLICGFGGQEDPLRLVSVADGKTVRTFGNIPSFDRVVAIAAGRHYLVSGRHLGATIYDLTTGAELGAPLESVSIGSVALRTDDSLAAIGPNYGAISLWDPAHGEVGKLDGHSASVTALHFKSGGRLLLSGGGDGRLCIWDVESRRLLGTLVVMGWAPDWVVYAPDGRCDGTAAGISRLEGHRAVVPGLLRTLLGTR